MMEETNNVYLLEGDTLPDESFEDYVDRLLLKYYAGLEEE